MIKMNIKLQDLRRKIYIKAKAEKSWRFWGIYVHKKVLRHLMRSLGSLGFGWARWSRNWIYEKLGLYKDYKIRYYQASKVSPVR